MSIGRAIAAVGFGATSAVWFVGVMVTIMLDRSIFMTATFALSGCVHLAACIVLLSGERK